MLAVHVSCDILAPVFALRNVRSIFKLIQLEAWQHSIHDDNIVVKIDIYHMAQMTSLASDLGVWSLIFVTSFTKMYLK